MSLSKEARELLERAIHHSRTYARNNMGGDREAAEHIFGLCGLLEGALLVTTGQGGACAQQAEPTDWMWCYENPHEAAREIDRLRANQSAAEMVASQSAEPVALTITDEAAMRFALRIIANLEDRSGVLDAIDDEIKQEIADEIAVTVKTQTFPSAATGAQGLQKLLWDAAKAIQWHLEPGSPDEHEALMKRLFAESALLAQSAPAATAPSDGARQEEPVATLHSNGRWEWKDVRNATIYKERFAGFKMDVYAAPAPGASPAALTDAEWLWMTHPTRNNGKPIPVRIVTSQEDGSKWFIPFDEGGCEFEWAERDEDWRIVAAPQSASKEGM